MCPARRAAGAAEDIGGHCCQCAAPGRAQAPPSGILQINTKNILFICGGAFDGIGKDIEQRLDKKTIGFGAEIQRKREKDNTAVFKQVQPHDLLKFGIIPELVGRMPVITALQG